MLQPLNELKKGLEISGGNRRIKIDNREIRLRWRKEFSRGLSVHYSREARKRQDGRIDKLAGEIL